MADEVELVSRQGDSKAKPLKEPWPVGTLAELKEHGLDPWQYASCAQKDIAAGITGCPMWDRCSLRGIKGVSGPTRFGIQFIKPDSMGGGVRNVDVDCFTAVALADKAAVSKNGELVRVIAKEGETITVIGSEAVKNNIGTVTGYTDVTETRVVEPFKRIKDNKKLLKDAMAGALRVQHAEAQKAALLEDRLAQASVSSELLHAEPVALKKPDRSK